MKRTDQISYKNIEAVSRVLNREIDQIEFENLWIDWKAFARNPEKYADTIVVEMIQQYLDE